MSSELLLGRVRRRARCYSAGAGYRAGIGKARTREESAQAPAVVSGEAELLTRLRAGDEQAFLDLVDAESPAMLRLAGAYTRDRALAEDIVQETWINVLKGIAGFEGRCPLRAWIFTVLGNCARRRLRSEGRSIPFSALRGGAPEEPLDVDRFLPAEHPRWAHCWATVVRRWDELPEDQMLSRHGLAAIATAIAQLPTLQAAVLVLRDVEGWPAREVCETLAITDGNQRVLLHRARSHLREALEDVVQTVDGRG